MKSLSVTLQWIRSILFDLWLYLSMAVIGVLMAPAAMVSREGAYFATRLFARQALWALKWICGVEIEVRGTPPQGRTLIAAKHQSFLDIIIMLAILPRPTFVMKRSLIYAPVLGFYALRLGVAPVDRRSGASAMREMRKRLAALGEEGRQIVIYPQGTRLPPGAVAPYRPGVALLYAGEPAGCTPVATDTGLYWGRNAVLKKPGRAVVSFLAPIPPDLKRAAFMELVEQRIETASTALLEEAKARACDEARS